VELSYRQLIEPLLDRARSSAALRYLVCGLLEAWKVLPPDLWLIWWLESLKTLVYNDEKRTDYLFRQVGEGIKLLSLDTGWVQEVLRSGALETLVRHTRNVLATLAAEPVDGQTSTTTEAAKPNPALTALGIFIAAALAQEKS
jgi:hypothetical protein